jgi:WD40 repeat protein
VDIDREVIITSTVDGVIQVGPLAGEPPHLLYGHSGVVRALQIDPSGRWIYSAGTDGTLRMWAMPDLSKPPLHTLPHDELLEKLYSLTNMRVVEDEESTTGYRLDFDPFPGWERVPDW